MQADVRQRPLRRPILVVVVTVAVALLFTTSPASADGPALQGTVTSASGPVATMGVYVYLGSTQTLVASVATNASGQYTVPSLAPGSYRLLFWNTASPYAPTYYPGVASSAASTQVVISAGTTTTADQYLAVAGSISGTVTGGGLPRSGVPVWAVTVPEATPITLGTTDAAGHFTIPKLAPGTYRMLAWTLGYTWWFGGSGFANATDVVVAPGANTVADTDVTIGAIRGNVHTASAGLASIRVWLLSEAGSLVRMVNTDASGDYVMTNVAAGSYHLVFTDPTFAYIRGAHWPDAPDFRSGDSVVVLGGGVSIADQQLYLPADQPVEAYAGLASGPKVAVIGDSITQGSTWFIHDALDPIARTSVQGINVQRIDNMQPTAEKYALTSPDQVLIALGTNNANQNWPQAQNQADLNALISTFPDAACINVLTVNNHTAVASMNAYLTELNDYIRTLAVRDARVKVIEWDVVTTGVTGWTVDGVHLSDVGKAALAATMREAVESCPAPVTWSASATNSAGAPGIGRSVAVDATGNTFVAGSIYAPATFGATTITPSSGSNVFVAKYDPSGALEWVRQSTGGGSAQGIKVTVTTGGQAVVTGDAVYPITFAGSPPISGLGAIYAYHAAFNADGSLAWTNTVSSTSESSATSIAATPDGGVVMTGGFSGAATFAPGTTVTTAATHGYLAKYDSAGAFQWVREMSSTTAVVPTDIAADASGHLVVAGAHGGADFGGGVTLAQGPSASAFVARFDSAGTIEWATELGGTATSAALGVAVDPTGAGIFVTGAYGGGAMAQGAIAATGQIDAFVAGVYSSGTIAWVRGIGGAGGVGVTVATRPAFSNGHVYVPGLFGGTVTAQGPLSPTATRINTSMTPQASLNSYVATFNLLGELELVRTVTGDGNYQIWGVASSSTGPTIVGNGDGAMVLQGAGVALGHPAHGGMWVASLAP